MLLEFLVCAAFLAFCSLLVDIAGKPSKTHGNMDALIAQAAAEWNRGLLPKSCTAFNCETYIAWRLPQLNAQR